MAVKALKWKGKAENELRVYTGVFARLV